MASYGSFPAELYPEILGHTSKTDLKVYALVNSFFRSIAQPALFSLVRMVDDVEERLLFFATDRGLGLIKHAKSIILGPDFCVDQDLTRASLFIQALDHKKIHTLHFFGYIKWDDIPENILTALYKLVMPHLHTLVFWGSVDIPFTQVLSHCASLQNVELDHAYTSIGNTTKLNVLPNVRNFTLAAFDSSDLAPHTSLGAYLGLKGSSIEALSLGGYSDDEIPFSMDLFASLKPHLRRLTFSIMMLPYLIPLQPLQFNTLPRLQSLYFTVSPRAVLWTAFLEFLDIHLEKEYFSPSLKDIHVRVVGDKNGSLTAVNFGSCDDTLLRLARNRDIHLHVVLHIRDSFAENDGDWVRAASEEYDMLQNGIESSLSQWVQAGRLAVTRQAEDISW